MATQGEIEEIQAMQLAERLISTVVRAFFDDECILVVSAIMREKYLKDKDDDLGGRLGLLPKQVRKTLAKLQAEGLVRSEEMPDEFKGGRKANYWYVDYRYTVNVIRLRIYLMQQHLKQREKRELATQTYLCPQCKATYSVMEIQKLRNGASGFCCSHCCENDLHGDCGKSAYSLRDFDNRERLLAVQAELKDLKDQLSLSAEKGCSRDGIFELVKQLHDVSLPSNLPSELRARGVGGATGQHGASRLARFQDTRFDLQAQHAAAQRQKLSSSRAMDLLYTRNAAGQEVVVELEAESESEDEDLQDVLPSRADRKRKAQEERREQEQEAKRIKKAAPSFLVGSRISGTATGTSVEEGPPSERPSEATAAAPHQQQGDTAAGVAEAHSQHKARFLEELAKQRAILRNGEDEEDGPWVDGDQPEEGDDSSESEGSVTSYLLSLPEEEYARLYQEATS